MYLCIYLYLCKKYPFRENESSLHPRQQPQQINPITNIKLIKLYNPILNDEDATSFSSHLLDDNAITDAKRNFAAEERVEIVHGKVEKVLKRYVAANVVVFDPPRSGAGVTVIEAVIALRPRVIVYVACDPASLARDTAYLMERGFKLEKLRAFDLFPMTAHMECVARFIPE